MALRQPISRVGGLILSYGLEQGSKHRQPVIG